MPRSARATGRRDAPSGRTLAGLRRRSAREAERYAVYRVAIELPAKAIGAVLSRNHPDLRIELVNRMEIPSDLVLFDVRIHGPKAGELGPETRAFPGVIGVEVHEEGPESAMYRLLQRTPVVMKVMQANRVLARYPISIQAGWMRFETIAKASQIRRLLRDAGHRVGINRVEAVRRGPILAQNLGLTAAQDALFRFALGAGYFTSPRGISISELSKRLGRSKSSTSEMLAKIQRRLAEHAVQFDLTPLVTAA